MNAADYFLPKSVDDSDLSAWSPILPTEVRVLRTNLFGDAFVVDGTGAVHILERAACSAGRIASSEEEFWREVREDVQGWQLRILADECRRAAKTLGAGQCYAFTTLPMLGGDYAVENVWAAHWTEWFSFTAYIFDQIKDLPDGATVSFKIAISYRPPNRHGPLCPTPTMLCHAAAMRFHQPSLTLATAPSRGSLRKPLASRKMSTHRVTLVTLSGFEP